jgi:hypothetical protein
MSEELFVLLFAGLGAFVSIFADEAPIQRLSRVEISVSSSADGPMDCFLVF